MKKAMAPKGGKKEAAGSKGVAKGAAKGMKKGTKKGY